MAGCAVEDGPWLRALVTRLTDRFEAPRPAPWQVSDAPPDYIDAMLRAIVGIEIEAHRTDRQMEGQPEPRRRRPSRRGCVAALGAGGDAQAAAMAGEVGMAEPSAAA